eukprot:PITA_24980
MIITSWNIRGLNSKGKHRYLKEALKKDKPSIMLIQETKMDQQQLQEIMKRMRPEYEVMAQDAVSSVGVLAIIWNPEELIFENWISLPRILSGLFRLTGMEERILISGVYGPHLPRDQKEFLKNMQAIRRIIPGSDHWPIRLEIDIKKNNGKKPFRFEAFWLRNTEFLHKVEEWWTQSRVKGKGKMHTIQLKLKEIKGKIRKWNREEFGHIMEEKQKLEREMEDIQ